MGNGPSLDNVSLDFLRSRPSFGLNYMPTYNDLLDGFMPTYWLALDQHPTEIIPSLPYDLPKFIPRRKQDNFEKDNDEKRRRGKDILYPNLVGFKMGDMKQPAAMGYGSSLIAAAHVAGAHMKAKRIFLVGFDCEKAMQSKKPYKMGKVGCPHFYDPDHAGKHMKGWCNQMGIYAKWLQKRGQDMINLSHPTTCKSVPQGYFWDYMEAT